MSIKLISLLFYFLSGFFLCAYGMQSPLRDPSDLTPPSFLDRFFFKLQPRTIPIVKLNGARVVIADYPLLKRDFPQLESKSFDEIDSWMIENTAYLRTEQVELGLSRFTNTELAVNWIQPNLPEIVDHKAWQPMGYGRALVFEAGDGLLDAKGTGTADPQLGNHSNGLAPLWEMLSDFAMEKLVHEIFRIKNFETVQSYAVLDLGFQVNSTDPPSWERAGMLIRQAHRRGKRKYSRLAHEKQLEREALLREYGITSVAVDYTSIAKLDPNQIGLLRYNIQGSDENDVVDFGTFAALERFSGQRFDLTRCPVQPDETKRVPIQDWGIIEKTFTMYETIPDSSESRTWIRFTYEDKFSKWTEAWAGRFEHIPETDGPRYQSTRLRLARELDERVRTAMKYPKIDHVNPYSTAQRKRKADSIETDLADLEERPRDKLYRSN